MLIVVARIYQDSLLFIFFLLDVDIDANLQLIRVFDRLFRLDARTRSIRDKDILDVSEADIQLIRLINSLCFDVDKKSISTNDLVIKFIFEETAIIFLSRKIAIENEIINASKSNFEITKRKNQVFFL